MKQETKEKLCKVRDYFWPMLDGEEDTTKSQLEKDECGFVDEENIDKAIEIALLYLKSEDERRASVESKAAFFIGAFSLAATILIEVVKDFILRANTNPVIIVFTSVSIIYLCRAVLYAVDALSRKSYTTIGIPQFLYTADKEYKEKLFLEVRNCIFSNFNVINQKVDSMTMAQSFFKCAVRAVMVLVFIVLVMFIVA